MPRLLLLYYFPTNKMRGYVFIGRCLTTTAGFFVSVYCFVNANFVRRLSVFFYIIYNRISQLYKNRI